MARKKKEQDLALTEEQLKQMAEDPAENILDQVSIEEPNADGLLLDFPTQEVDKSEGEAVAIDDEPVRPQMSSPEWPDYVMSHFTEDELVNGHPKVDGLRRVVELLLGPIVQGQVRIVEGPRQDNGFTAVAEYTATIECFYEDGPGGKFRVWTSAADAGPNNCDPHFGKFPTALAETRARGRTFREALRLNKCAAEEMVKVPVDPQEEKGLISRNDISFIDMMCARLNIDAGSFMNYWIKEKIKKKYNKIRDIESEHARAMSKQLSEWQRKKEEIPEHLFGYKQGWNEKV